SSPSACQNGPDWVADGIGIDKPAFPESASGDTQTNCPCSRCANVVIETGPELNTLAQGVR
ncbi:MAG TPA: hypothetical protein VNY05_30765, partial [Candidatus Acidoferrales bacterium]|nr:hypothetical protein [Candidatus Acidoferrales bacterium]